MCGISCIIRFPALSSPTGISLCPHGGIHREALCHAVRRRGPDASRILSFVPSHSGSSSSCATHVDATSAVLSLRGFPGGAPQPAVAPEDSGAAQASFLQWNGEVFGGRLDIPTGESDTAAVMRHLRQLEREQCASAPPPPLLLPDTTEEEKERQQRAFAESCVRFFEFEVEGPYAFVYYAHSLGIFLIGRDPLGRRSLVTHASTVPRAATIFDTDVVDHVDADAKLEKSMELEFVIASVTAPHINEPSSPVTAHTSDSTSRPRRRLRENEEDNHHNHNHTKDSKNKELYSDPEEDTGNDKDDETDARCDCWRELPNTGLFLVRASGLSHFPWTRPHTVHPLLRFQLQPRRSLSMPSPMTDEWAASYYLSALRGAVAVRVAAAHCGGDGARPIGILFSGGIDSTVLAALADHALPTATPIELINVAFGDSPELTPDRIAAFRAWAQLLAISRGGREWRLVLIDVERGAEATDTVRRLVRPGGSVIDMSIGTALWHAAQGHGRMQRIYAGKDDTGAREGEKEKKDEEQGEVGKEEEEKSNEHRHEAAAATRRIPHKHIRLSDPTHDTATDKEHIILHEEDKEHAILREEDKDSGGDPYAPLVSAIISELESAGGADAAAPVLLSTLGKDYAIALRPALSRGGHRRLGSYVSAAAADGVVAFARRDEASSKAVRLIRATDMSRVRRAAPALWLSRSDLSTKKKNENENDNESGSGVPLGETRAAYVAESRVLLIGMGADETLGGYTRHRRAYERRGCAGLAEELRLDFARLWRRNLGRDDRAVGDSGREGRCPFLDEGVLEALGDIAAAAAEGACGEEALRVAMAPVCDLARGGPGVGDKKILRRCAEMIGLGEVVRLQKRAIQFGSRIAHAHPSK